MQPTIKIQEKISKNDRLIPRLIIPFQGKKNITIVSIADASLQRNVYQSHRFYHTLQ